MWAAPAAQAAQDIAQPEVIEEYLRQGQQALERDDLAAAQAAFESILRFEPDHPLAKQFLQRVNARAVMRQESQLRAKAAKLRADAMELALEVAREKAGALAHRETESQRQLARARERRLKALYTKGLDLYRRGAYEQAIELFQQIPLLDPSHPLVSTSQQLIVKAETKLAEKRARLAAQLPQRGTAVGAAKVSELEQALAAKRLEQETTLKHAKLAFKDKRYDQTIELAQRVLAQEPGHEPARKLVHEAEFAKLKTEEADLERRLELDDQKLVNAVSRAELLTQEAVSKPPPVGPRQTEAGAAVPPAVLSRLQEPISFDFQEVALSDVLDFLADSANVSIIPSPRVDLKEQRVSLRVDNLPLEMALKYLVKNLGLAYRAEGNVLLIATAEEFDNEPLETRVFFLRHGLGPSALETSAVEPGTKLEMESLKGVLEQTVSQPSGSKLVVDERSGSLIMTNTGENLRKVERLLSELDVTPIQVLIEARFVDITLTELEQRAFESVLTGDYAITKKGVQVPGVEPAFKGRDPANIIAKGGGFKFPALARESEGANITLQGVLSALQFETVLHLLEETQKSKTLSAPRVTTLNNQAASIKVVDEFRYPTRYEVSLVQFDINGDGDFDDAGETEFVNVPQDLQKRDVGILLNVTPSVGKDLKTITLVLSPEVSTFSKFRDLGGSVSVPEFTSSQLTTSVVIEAGQTVVLGGLMKDTFSEQVTKVPILGDVPLLGVLFQQRRETQERKNLIIFVTARVLAPRGPTI